MKYAVVGIFFALIACQTSTKVEVGEGVQSTPSWNDSMNELQQNLKEIEPYLYDSQKFADPKNRKRIGGQIKKMATASKKIDHNPTLMHRDPTVRFVASRFSQDLQRVDQAFTEDKISFARYELMKITSSCVLCHTRTQQGAEVTYSKSEPFLKSLSIIDQMEYLVASRKFGSAMDLALTTLESNKKLSLFETDQIARLGLSIAVQYEQKPILATRLINALQKRKGISYALRSESLKWQDSVTEWEKSQNSELGFEQLEKLVRNNQSTLDVMRAVPNLLAYLSKDLSRDELGEALLLTGEAYEILNSFTPQELHENYYEACIKSVPHSAVAQKCYKKIENSTLIGYSGSSGTHMPVEVHIWLQQLKKESE